MHATKQIVENGEYICPICDTAYDEDDMSAEDVVEFKEYDIYSAPDGVHKYVSEWTELTYNVCGNGCRFERQPVWQDSTVWICNNCKSSYSDSEDAADCCL